MGEPKMPPPPLSSEARDLLRAFAEQESPTLAERHEGWAALQDRIEDEPSSLVSGVVVGPWGRGQKLATIVGITVGLAAALVLVMKLAVVGVTALADGSRQSAMEAPYQGGAESEGGQASTRAPGAVPSPRPSSRRAPPQPEVAEVIEQPPPASPEPSRTIARPKKAAPAPASPSDLQAEIELLARAATAKREGRFEAGLAAMREHARRFAKGTLADERRVLTAELLCAAGRTDEAKANVRKFLRQRSGSALAGRMRKVCVGEKP